MPPKTTKKTVEAPQPAEDSIDSLKQEWMTVVKDISNINDQLTILSTKRDEIVTKIWELMNKNPVEAVEEKPAPKKGGKAVAKEEDEEEKKPAPKKATKAEEPEKKAPAKKTTKAVEKEKPAEKPAKETPAKKAPAKKVSAPAKGTPKPKLDEDEEEATQALDKESSSETDLDSLSSVSESDPSGDEDN